MNYTQLTQELRYQINALLKMGHNQTEIATVIGMHKSTVSKEFRRNKGQRGYRPKQAHGMTLCRRNRSRKAHLDRNLAADRDKAVFGLEP